MFLGSALDALCNITSVHFTGTCVEEGYAFTLKQDDNLAPRFKVLRIAQSNSEIWTYFCTTFSFESNW